MNAMNILPLQVTAAATLLALVLAFWLKTGDGLRARLRAALIWMAFIGLAVALRAGALVSIDIAHRLSRGLLRHILEGISLASILLMLGVMFWFGWTMAERVKFQEMAGLEVSMAWGYAAIPIGAVFAMLGSIAHFLDRRSEELESAV
jgi:TRAP-type C4-dicarboxylate transport system permease small subunit